MNHSVCVSYIINPWKHVLDLSHRTSVHAVIAACLFKIIEAHTQQVSTHVLVWSTCPFSRTPHIYSLQWRL